MSLAPLGSDPTARELEVLRLAAQGLTCAEIGGKLTISRHTAHTHLRRAMDRLGARSRAQAIALAYERRWLRPAWDDGRDAEQVRVAQTMATRWAALPGATGRDAVLRDVGRALLTVLDNAGAGERP